MERLIKTTLTETKWMQDYRPEIIIVAPAAIGKGYKSSPFAYQLNDESIIKSHEIGPLYKQLADKYNCLFLDCTDILEVSKIDSEHLTEASHSKLAELLAQLIK